MFLVVHVKFGSRKYIPGFPGEIVSSFRTHPSLCRVDLDEARSQI